jgi:uncharacterized repeat protein (TIGR03803 family)
MNVSLRRYALKVGGTAVLLSGCGGAQIPAAPPVGSGASGILHRLSGSSSYEVLHRFSMDGRAASAHPSASLLNVNGTLYGTTSGQDRGKYQCGTVFSITPAGVAKTLYRFQLPNGCAPFGGLIDVNGTLYGTTSTGGAHGYGTVFSLTPSGAETVLYSFKGAPDGYQPWGGLVDLNGTLYGTTAYGGSGGSSNCPASFGDYGCGTVFSVTTSGSESVLHSFKGEPDGMQPTAPLIALKGKLYGTTTQGGLYWGTVFSITPAGSEHVVYSFKGGGDGSWPFAPLVAVNGTLYGTADDSGSSDNGTVYSVTPSGSENVLYKFAGGSDGANPSAGLTYVNGRFYGATDHGGGSGCSGGTGTGCGTIYSLTPSGSENVLYRFQSGSDGAIPHAALVNLNGTLYGTTLGGGAKAGNGTVYSITP